MANKRSDSFWNEIRTIPLTEIETKSYKHSDSLRIVKQIEFKSDSTKAKRDSSKVDFISILTGRSFRLSKKWVLDYEGPFQPQNATYNTIDGYVLESSFNFKRQFHRDNTYYIKPLVRYAFGRQAVSGIMTTGWAGRRRGISLTGGRYVSQFNADNPISANVNTTSTLWFENNFMKIYEKDFGKLSFNYARLADVFSIKGNLEYGRRYELTNLENARPWIRWNQFAFSPNAPFNQEYSNRFAAKELNYRFETHEALTFDLSITWRPGQQYRLYNGRKRYLNNKNPSVILKYSKGIPNIANSVVDYDLVELSLNQDVET